VSGARSRARPPAVGTVVLAGVGLIGGSIGLGLHQRFLAERVIGLDPDPTALDAARGLGVIDEARLEPGPWLARGRPGGAGHAGALAGALARELAPHLRPDAVVTDVGSVKAPLVRRSPACASSAGTRWRARSAAACSTPTRRCSRTPSGC
jgi:prephenate dehydrogenase